MPNDVETIAACEACDSPMDISAVAPFSNVVCPSCGHQSRVKTQFGPYTLTHRYAVGGMSMVFSATDNTLNREVAVKILSEDYSQDQKRIDAFEEEARITASFSHPNVVSVLRTGYAFGRYYIAMELVSGGHFEHHIRERQRIPEGDLLPIAMEVTHGLKAAKAAGLIHRDVKPGNILLDNEGHAKLVDFGLSLVTHGGTAKAEELWATPFYVPPETVEGREEDFRSDMYALGSTLYHALAGIPPCNEDSMSTDVLLAAKQQIVPLKQVAPDVSDKTCAVIDQAMAYDPGDRFVSYDDMIHELRKSEKDLRQSKNQHHLRVTQGHMLPPLQGTSPKPYWAMISIAAAIVVAVALMIPRLKSAGPNTTTGNNPVSGDNTNSQNQTGNGSEDSINQHYRRARTALREGEYENASDLFAKLHTNTNLQEPTRSWAGIESVICSLLDANSRQARRYAKDTHDHLRIVKDEVIDTIGDEIPYLLVQLDSFPPLISNSRESATETVIAGMLAGLKNWQQGMLDAAAECFRSVASAKLSANDQWVAPYQLLASDYLSDYGILTGPLFRSIPVDLARCEKLIGDLDETVDRLKTKGRARYNLRAWQLDLARQAKQLRDAESQ